MTRPNWLLYVAVGGAFVAGWLLRGARPTRVEYRDREVVRTVTVQAQAERRTDVQAGPVRVVTRTVQLPGRVETVVERVEGPVRTVEVDARSSTAAATVREVERVRIVTAPPPRWSLGAFARTGLDLRPTYGPEVGVRVLGPLWAGAAVDVPARAALVRAWVTW